MTQRIDVIKELRAADPAPDQADIDRITENAIRRLNRSDVSAGGSAARHEADDLAVDRDWAADVVDPDRARRSPRVPVLAAAAIALVIVAVAVVVSARSADAPNSDIATSPTATTADHAGQSPFPDNPTTYAPEPTINNSVAARYPTAVVATVTTIGPIAEQGYPPDYTGHHLNNVMYRYVPVTIRVDDVLVGTVSAGDELHTRVILFGDVEPVIAVAGDRLLLFLSGPGPAGSPADGNYTVGAGFFVDGDTVIDWRTNATRPLSTVRSALSSPTAAPSTPGSTPVADPTATTTAPPTAGLSVRIELPSSALAAGASMDGQVIVENTTGQPVNAVSCISPFGVTLSNDQAQQTGGSKMCAQTFVFDVGESSWPITIVANYGSCTSGSAPADHSIQTCLPGGGSPPLPPGRYTATLQARGVTLSSTTPIDVTEAKSG